MNDSVSVRTALPKLPSLQSSAAWPAASLEEALEPALPIVDCHHHFLEHRDGYLLPDLLADTGGGRRSDATVYIQCGWHREPDRAAAGYGVVWNALKRVASGATAQQKSMLFHRTAARVYHL